MQSMRQYVAEFIGTFILVFAGTAAIVVSGNLTNIALTFGLVVAAMVYSLGGVSGAHINPAVTIGLCAARRFPVNQVLPYIVAQCLGAIAASATLKGLYSVPDIVHLGATLPLKGDWLQSFFLEIIVTGLLMFVILTVTAAPKDIVPFAGLVIGGVITLEVLFAGPISGASMNPARSIGPAVVSGHLQHLWIYLVATTLGALVAVGLCHYLLGGQKESA